ncbi:MAG: superoxide dismutase [Candidatus Staskawiczbacteria bacterium RIFCSPHIGHO2_02_FULL_34_9]|uniref:Superoxide dismutase n=1 Tax=Candidatus Staskawiczbacteria bacterium RIFCSPHIGHO2_02_FULL_34_9 TaxID=1802206 RepID=A0A1G2I5N8_9BACT|nr:MAG: superoxide dismutase [Candidatus Staskawiczbacteria bacterium RIFCSPHIGHO2_02_FULL_34_9]
MMYTLPELPYDYSALEPYIDTETMKLHHDKHHASYVKNLNDAIEKHPELAVRTAEELLLDLNSIPEDIRMVVKNSGGGHVNHSMFWQIMGPNAGGSPSGVLLEAINNDFGSFADFQKKFEETGLKRFGSGWVWLIKDKEGKLDVVSTQNQDNPMSDGSIPIIGNDVWEHAYYLKYKNMRVDYLKEWWNVVNWQEAENRFER